MIPQLTSARLRSLMSLWWAVDDGYLHAYDRDPKAETRLSELTDGPWRDSAFRAQVRAAWDDTTSWLGLPAELRRTDILDLPARTAFSIVRNLVGWVTSDGTIGGDTIRTPHFLRWARGEVGAPRSPVGRYALLGGLGLGAGLVLGAVLQRRR